MCDVWGPADAGQHAGAAGAEGGQGAAANRRVEREVARGGEGRTQYIFILNAVHSKLLNKIFGR